MSGFPNRFSSRGGRPCLSFSITAGSTIFSLLFSLLSSDLAILPCLSLSFISSPSRPYACPRATSSPSCRFVRAASCPFLVLMITLSCDCYSSERQPFFWPTRVIKFCFQIIFVCAVVLSYPVRWHLSCFTVVPMNLRDFVFFGTSLLLSL